MHGMVLLKVEVYIRSILNNRPLCPKSQIFLSII